MAGPDWVQQSVEKLTRVSDHLQDIGIVCSLRPCRSILDTQEYRCRCSFQLVHTTETGFQYAVRESHQPVIIAHSPIASKRIQICMEFLLDALNNGKYDAVTSPHLTSAAFVASWSNQMDCLVTLNYDKPIQNQNEWMEQARHICDRAELTQLTGRSKGSCVRARGSLENGIHDFIWISKSNWEVRHLLEDPPVQRNGIEVHYWKPEDAFSHPNRHVMGTALQWMLTRVAQVQSSLGRSCRLLELYCGYGAHTMPLAKSGLCNIVVAVELDIRLVEACLRNCRDNEVHDIVHVVAQDAGVWAQTSVDPFDVLLVDPPRQGLDEAVCRLACQGTFSDLLYISCGKEALLRDIQRLRSCFDVLDCTLLDLFPRTHSVESLVHMCRRK